MLVQKLSHFIKTIGLKTGIGIEQEKHSAIRHTNRHICGSGETQIAYGIYQTNLGEIRFNDTASFITAPVIHNDDLKRAAFGSFKDAAQTCFDILA
jgi:hypothetical protein